MKRRIDSAACSARMAAATEDAHKQARVDRRTGPRAHANVAGAYFLEEDHDEEITECSDSVYEALGILKRGDGPGEHVPVDPEVAALPVQEPFSCLPTVRR